MHPELFELKALVAGRLDAHRRREIDDHLGSCADCSRHYVAMMLGSPSPKTAEAEAREGLVPSGSGTLLTLAGGEASLVQMYGIDAPLKPSAPPRPASPRRKDGNSIPLETEFPPAAARMQPAATGSLVDAITRLRAESESAKAAAPQTPVVEVIPPAAVAPVDPPAAGGVTHDIVAPVAGSPLLAPSIFTPTPYGGVSLILPSPAPLEPGRSEGSLGESLDSFEPMGQFAALDAYTPPEQFAPAEHFASPETFTPAESFPLAESFTPPPAPSVPVSYQAPAPAPELVVTFSSTPKRTTAQRSPTTVPAVTPSQEYVSQAVATHASSAASAFEFAPAAATPARAPNRKLLMLGGALAAAALVIVLGLSGYKYFKSSVSQAASAAALAAAQKVEAAAARSTAGGPSSRAAAPAPMPTRIVYVERPSSRDAKSTRSRPETVSVSTAMPITVTLPEVNLNTGAESAVQSNTQRNATTELTRSARATASRTAAPRP